MTRILDVQILRQKTDYECGNTALAAVLQYSGKAYPIDQLAELANTRTVGTDHADMIAAAEATGATVIARSGGGPAALEEVVNLLARDIPVICGWWSMELGDLHYDPGWTLEERMTRDRGHYSVLRGYTATSLLLMDPDAGYREYGKEEWMRLWYDTDTDAYEVVTTWYMALAV